MSNLRHWLIVPSLPLLLAFAGGPAFAQSCGNTNPNCVVPTRPPGDNTNAAASTAFVTQAVVALSTRQILPFGNAGTAFPQAVTSFAGVIASGTEVVVQFLCPIGGTFKNLFIQSSAPASGQTITNTLRVNNADTAVTCLITGPATTCNDTTHTATCTAGQTYDLKVVTSATSGSIANFAGGVEFDNP